MKVKTLYKAKHTPTVEAFRSLMARIGMSQAEVASRTGICERRVRYLQAGQRETAGKTMPVVMTYPEQFILEDLADSVEKVAKQRQ